MGTDYDNIRITDSSDVVLMYLPLTSTIEEVWGNNLTVASLPWSRGGALVADIKTWSGEIVIQGTFISTIELGDADLITALETLMGVVPGVEITGREQYNFMLDKLITTTGGFRLYYNDDSYKFTGGSRDIKAGDYPPIVPKDVRAIAEGSKDKYDFTLRCVIAATSLERA